jgi:predicted ATPase with chaperone activity
VHPNVRCPLCDRLISRPNYQRHFIACQRKTVELAQNELKAAVARADERQLEMSFREITEVEHNSTFTGRGLKNAIDAQVVDDADVLASANRHIEGCAQELDRLRKVISDIADLVEEAEEAHPRAEQS